MHYTRCPSTRCSSCSEVLAPFAVDQAAVRCSCGHENVDSSAVPVSLSWTVTEQRMTATRIRRERPGAVKMSLQFSRVLTKPACIGGGQGDSNEAAPEDGVVDDGLGVSIGAAAEHARGPQAGTALDSRKQPHGAALAADERAELFSLQLQDVELAQPSMDEALSRCRGSLEPSRDGGAGMARDPGGRRNAHALDAQACDLVELPSARQKAA